MEKSTEETRKGLKNYLTTVGKPRLIQTDNGVEFTYYFVSRTNTRRQKGERYSAFEQLLEEEKIEHHLIRPRTPQHNGKVERIHRSSSLKESEVLPFYVGFTKFSHWLDTPELELLTGKRRALYDDAACSALSRG